MMRLSTSWLALLLLYIVFQADSNGFATSSDWTHHNPRCWGIGNRGRQHTPSTCAAWGASLRSPTAFIHSEESTKTTAHTGSSMDDATVEDIDHESPIQKSHSSVSGGAIVVSAALELPFPKRVAYDAFSDLSRQSTYSPWLKSVEYIEGERNSVGSKTRWKLNYLGLRFTWKSISTLQDPQNGVIEWESITGLQNNGRVTFQELDNDRTFMNMTMSFTVPRIASRLLGPHKIASIVEKRILETTVCNFRQIVCDNDWKAIQMQKQQKQDDPSYAAAVASPVTSTGK